MSSLSNTLAMRYGLEVFAKTAGGTDTPISQVMVFLVVAQRSEITLADIAKETGVVLSSASRNVAKMGPGANPNEPGLGLVESFEDPWNRKRKLVRLTSKGRKLAERINEEVTSRLKT